MPAVAGWPDGSAAAPAGTVGMQLLERQSQLAALAEYAREAQRRDGRPVLVAGEAGVGNAGRNP